MLNLGLSCSLKDDFRGKQVQNVFGGFQKRKGENMNRNGAGIFDRRITELGIIDPG